MPYRKKHHAASGHPYRRHYQAASGGGGKPPHKPNNGDGNSGHKTTNPQLNNDICRRCGQASHGSWENCTRKCTFCRTQSHLGQPCPRTHGNHNSEVDPSSTERTHVEHLSQLVSHNDIDSLLQQVRSQHNAAREINNTLREQVDTLTEERDRLLRQLREANSLATAPSQPFSGHFAGFSSFGRPAFGRPAFGAPVHPQAYATLPPGGNGSAFLLDSNQGGINNNNNINNNQDQQATSGPFTKRDLSEDGEKQPLSQKPKDPTKDPKK